MNLSKILKLAGTVAAALLAASVVAAPSQVAALLSDKETPVASVSLVSEPLCSQADSGVEANSANSLTGSADPALNIDWMLAAEIQVLSGLMQPVLDASPLVYGVVPDHQRKLPIVVVDRAASAIETQHLVSSIASAVQDNGSVEVRYGCHSMEYISQLLDEIPMLIDEEDFGSSLLWGYRYDKGMIRVSIDNEANASRSAIAKRLGNDLVFFESEGTALTAGSRHSDKSPHYGGAAIGSRYYRWCTSGFAVNYGSTSKRAMVTAGHCLGTLSGTTFYSGNWTYGTKGAYMDGRSQCVAESTSCHDVGVIVSSYQKYENRIYSTWKYGSESRRVTSARDQRWSDSLCVSGQISGEQCGLTLTASWKSNACYGRDTEHNCKVYLDDIAIAKSNSGSTVFQGGDSGAPVYSKIGSKKARIVGLGVASDDGKASVVFHPQSIVRDKASDLTGVNVTVAVTNGARSTF